MKQLLLARHGLLEEVYDVKFYTYDMTCRYDLQLPGKNVKLLGLGLPWRCQTPIAHAKQCAPCGHYLMMSGEGHYYLKEHNIYLIVRQHISKNQNIHMLYARKRQHVWLLGCWCSMRCLAVLRSRGMHSWWSACCISRRWHS